MSSCSSSCWALKVPHSYKMKDTEWIWYRNQRQYMQSSLAVLLFHPPSRWQVCWELEKLSVTGLMTLYKSCRLTSPVVSSPVRPTTDNLIPKNPPPTPARTRADPVLTADDAECSSVSVCVRVHACTCVLVCKQVKLVVFCSVRDQKKSND